MADVATALSLLEPICTGPVDGDAARVDKEGAWPSAAIDALGKAGLLGLTMPASVGGMGLGLDASAAVVERIARSCPSTAMIVCMHYCGAAVIAAHGDEAT